jgi:LysM repeat protein
MRDRSYARYLAPIALVVVVVAGAVVVASSGGSSSSGTKTATAPAARTKSGKAKKFYRVKAGDLITSISAKTGVDSATIIRLNHNLDPQSLQAGQLIRIRK